MMIRVACVRRECASSARRVRVAAGAAMMDKWSTSTRFRGVIHSRAHDRDEDASHERHVCDDFDEHDRGDAGVRADGAPTRLHARDDVVEIHAWGTRRGERARAHDGGTIGWTSELCAGIVHGDVSRRVREREGLLEGWQDTDRS